MNRKLNLHEALNVSPEDVQKKVESVFEMGNGSLTDLAKNMVGKFSNEEVIFLFLVAVEKAKEAVTDTEENSRPYDHDLRKTSDACRVNLDVLNSKNKTIYNACSNDEEMSYSNICEEYEMLFTKREMSFMLMNQIKDKIKKAVKEEVMSKASDFIKDMDKVGDDLSTTERGEFIADFLKEKLGEDVKVEVIDISLPKDDSDK